MRLPSPGDVVGDRFRLRREIGVGGFATVFEAVDLETSEPVAIKFLRLDPTNPDDEMTLLRFEREVDVLRQLRCEHTVQLLGHGRHNGAPFAAFELLDGVELADLLQELGPLSPPEVRRALGQLLEALQEAHAAGVLHRDLKPENIIVVNREPIAVKLIDFGIARSLHPVTPQITATGETIGTIRYMSPEQLTAKELTPASDIYSLGMVAVEMLIGRDGLQGGAIHDQMARMRSGHVFSVPQLERMDPELLRVIGRMTARKAADRFQSTAEVLNALDPPSHRVAFIMMAIVVLAAALALAITSNQSPTAIETAPPVRAKVRAPVPPDRPSVDAPKRSPKTVEQREAHCDPLPHSGFHGIDGRHRTLAWADPELTRQDVRAVIVLLSDGSGITLADHRAKMGFDEIAAREQALILVPDAKVDGTGGSWRANNAPQVALRVSLLLDSWCVSRDVPLYLVGEGQGGMGVDQWLCMDLPDVRQPDSVAVSAHRYAHQDARPCVGKKPPYLRLVQLENRVEPYEGGKSCSSDKYTFYSAARQESWWKTRYGCEGEPRRSEHDDGVCLHWTCGYSRCEVRGGRDWSGFQRDPTDSAAHCVGKPADFPYHAVVWDFFAAL